MAYLPHVLPQAQIFSPSLMFPLSSLLDVKNLQELCARCPGGATRPGWHGQLGSQGTQVPVLRPRPTRAPKGAVGLWLSCPLLIPGHMQGWPALLAAPPGGRGRGWAARRSRQGGCRVFRTESQEDCLGS